MPTLEDLSGKTWPEPKTTDTSLVKRCAMYVKTEVSDLDAEALRCLTSQAIFLNIIIPLVLKRLELNPWFEASFYQGDLLMSALRQIGSAEMAPHRSQLFELARLASESPPDGLSPDIHQELNAILAN